MNNIAKTTHPLVLIAAAAVTIASLAAVGHYTGLLPSRSAEGTPTTVAANALVPPPPAAHEAAKPEAPAAVAPAPAETPKPVAKPKRHSNAGPADRVYDERSGNHRVSTAGSNDAGIDVIPSRPPQVTNQGPVTAQVPAAPACRDCGTVESVREVTTKGEGTGLGAVAGGVLGGILGHQVGRGSGKDLATVAGAVGGAFGGHQIEKSVRSEKQYQVTVRFDDGTVRTYTQKSADGWRNGDRVRVDNGALRNL